jgi:mannose-1-phosphate guanylyltransferase
VNMKVVNVILSGGVGSRLWPLSRKNKPKQYLPLFEGKTLFQKTALRNATICDELIVVGNKDNHSLSQRDLEGAGISKYKEIIEACPRNTAAAIAFAAFSAQPGDILFVSPSDHLIGKEEAYQKDVRRAIELASQGYIVTLGLQPTQPETGFGYIEADGETVVNFHEKPNQPTAEQFVASGNHYWNSGMFCFQAGVFLSELAKFEPQVYERSKIAFEKMEEGYLDYGLSMQIPSISIDYAVMERTNKIKVVPSSFQWSDMGSFESIYEYLTAQGHVPDSNGNLVIGSNLHTEFVGVSGLILICTDDAMLVLNRNSSQDVKGVFERLEEHRPELV